MGQKVILITGASGGLGSAMSEFLYNQGHKLVLHSNKGKIKLPESKNLFHVKANLRDEKEVIQMFKKIEGVVGGVDILINNAGISKSGISWKTPLDEWQETIDVNLTAVFLTTKLSIPNMRKNKWGRIINISSIVGQTGFVGTVAYAASKAGLLGITKTLSKELASANITVNSLALGYFNQGMIRDVPEELKNEIIADIPMKKLGDPETICKTIDLLISDEGEYITGQTINLNGGLN